MAPGAEAPGYWDGVRGYAGATFGVGPVLVAFPGTVPDSVDGNLLGALRAGALIGHFEAGIELAPVTWMPYFDAKNGPVLSLTGTIGGIIQFTDHIYWPMRFRAGLVAVNTPNDDVATVLGFEIIGLGYRFDNHWSLEAALPSFRYAGVFDDAKMPDAFAWPINISAMYVF